MSNQGETERAPLLGKTSSTTASIRKTAMVSYNTSMSSSSSSSSSYSSCSSISSGSRVNKHPSRHAYGGVHGKDETLMYFPSNQFSPR